MNWTEKYQQLRDVVLNAIPRNVNFPLDLYRTADMLAVPYRGLVKILKEMRHKKLLDRELDRRIQLQPILDDEYLSSTHLVSAPLLTPEEIRNGQLVPGDANRPFLTLALPREFAGTGRYFSFQVTDDVMVKHHIRKGDIVVCCVGQFPRQYAPVVCVLPDGQVCVRTFHLINTPFFEIETPEHENIGVFSYYDDWDMIAGIVVSVQRYIMAWEGSYAKPVNPPEPKPCRKRGRSKK